MARLGELILLACVLLIDACHQHLQQVQAGNSMPKQAQSTYLVRAKLNRDVPEAVTQMNRFVPKNQDKSERCQRLAVLLNQLNGRIMDSVQIIDLAQAKSDEIKSKFRRIDVESLRDLYMGAIQQYLKDERVDANLMELVACLRDKFQETKTRTFLNQLKTLVEQYEMLASAPLEALLEPEEQQQLKMMLADGVEPRIKQKIQQLLAGDTRTQNELIGNEQVADEQMADEQVADEQVEAHAVAQAPHQLDTESHKYLAQMFGVVRQVYDSLRSSANLGDRCQAYSYVVNSEDDDLSHESFVESLVAETAEHIKTVGEREQVQLASEEERENFLFATEFAREFLQEVDDKALSDFLKCAKELQNDGSAAPIDETQTAESTINTHAQQ